MSHARVAAARAAAIRRAPSLVLPPPRRASAPPGSGAAPAPVRASSLDAAPAAACAVLDAASAAACAVLDGAPVATCAVLDSAPAAVCAVLDGAPLAVCAVLDAASAAECASTFRRARAAVLVTRPLGALVLGAAFAAVGCYERRLAPSVPCTTSVFEARVAGGRVDAVDLLLLIDDSSSMAGEQVLLGAELPRMIRVLASGDLDGDGEADFTPLRSLHVGIVTSDLGAGPALPPGETVPSCEPGLGDDGILRGRGVTTTAGGR